MVMYNKTSHLESVDETRMELFCHRNRTMENLPPTRAALFQHSLTSLYTKPAYGHPVKYLGRRSLVQNLGVGVYKSMDTSLDYSSSSQPSLSGACEKAVARVSKAVVPGVAARKPIGPALNFANATVLIK